MLLKGGDNTVRIQKPPEKTGSSRWGLSRRMLPYVIKEIEGIPVKYFLDIKEAPIELDMEKATDLTIQLKGGALAVRIRNYYYLKWADWSIRVYSNGAKTEIDKLKEGFVRWYFFGYANKEESGLAAEWLIDIEKALPLLDKKYDVRDNGDGTAGMYIPIDDVKEIDAILWSKPDNA